MESENIRESILDFTALLGEINPAILYSILHRDKETNAVEIVEEYELSIARVCKLMEIHRSDYYYQERWDNTEVEEVIRTAAKFLEDIQTSQAWKKEVETQEGLPCIQEYALRETCPFEEMLSSKCQDIFGTAIWAQYDMVYGFCGWYPGVQKEVPSTEHNGWQR